MNRNQEREEMLMNALHERGRLSIAEVVALLDVSEATARRLFVQMEKDQKLIRSYGGVQLPVSMDSYSFERYEKMLAAEKRRIGLAAAARVQNGDSIYMDSGTTLLRMAEALARRLTTGSVHSLTIVTNSLANLAALENAPGCRVLLLGGEYNRRRRDFSGTVTEKSLEMFHFRKCFLGCEGLSLQLGFSAHHLELANLDARVVERTERRHVLMDSSKFGSDALVAYAKMEEINVILTDRAPTGELADAIRKAGIELAVAPVGAAKSGSLK